MHTHRVSVLGSKNVVIKNETIKVAGRRLPITRVQDSTWQILLAAS